jgi:hypothetical protein
MRFTADNGRWWTQAAAEPDVTQAYGIWLPLLSLGGLLTAILFSAWRFDPAAGAGPMKPLSSSTPTADVQQFPALQVRLRADAVGRLASIALNGRAVRNGAELRTQIRDFFGPAAEATIVVELDCDGNLRYEDAQQTIEAISACTAADGRTVPLVNRVVFAPRRSGKQ